MDGKMPAAVFQMRLPPPGTEVGCSSLHAQALEGTTPLPPPLPARPHHLGLEKNRYPGTNHRMRLRLLECFVVCVCVPVGAAFLHWKSELPLLPLKCALLAA